MTDNNIIMNAPVEETEQKETVATATDAQEEENLLPIEEEPVEEPAPVPVTETVPEEELPEVEPEPELSLYKKYRKAMEKAAEAGKTAYFDQKRLLAWLKNKFDEAFSENECSLLFADEESKKEGVALLDSWIQEHKTFEKLWSYVESKAREEARAAKQNHFGCEDATVFGWAIEYIRRDDKAEEAERKAKAEKAAAERKAKAKKKAESKPAPKKEAAKGQADFMSMLDAKPAEKKAEGIQGQTSFLDMLNPAPVSEGGETNAD